MRSSNAGTGEYSRALESPGEPRALQEGKHARKSCFSTMNDSSSPGLYNIKSRGQTHVPFALNISASTKQTHSATIIQRPPQFEKARRIRRCLEWSSSSRLKSVNLHKQIRQLHMLRSSPPSHETLSVRSW